MKSALPWLVYFALPFWAADLAPLRALSEWKVLVGKHFLEKVKD